MKRNYKYITGLLLGLTLLVGSCKEGAEKPVPGPGKDDPNAVHISARVYDPTAPTQDGGDSGQTKTSLKPGNPGTMLATWNENDQIGIIKTLPNKDPKRPIHYVYAYTADDPTAVNPTEFSWTPTTETLMWEDFTNRHKFFAYYPAGTNENTVNSVAMPALANQNYFNINANAPLYNPMSRVGNYDFLYTFETSASYLMNPTGVDFEFYHANSLLELWIAQNSDPNRKMTIKSFYISAKGLTINRSFDLVNSQPSEAANIVGSVGINYAVGGAPDGGQPAVPYTTSPTFEGVKAMGYFVVNPLKRQNIFSFEVIAEETVDGNPYDVFLQGTFEMPEDMEPGKRYGLKINIEKRQAVVANITVAPWVGKGTITDNNVGFAPYIRKTTPVVDPPVIDAIDDPLTTAVKELETVVKFTTNTEWKVETTSSWLTFLPDPPKGGSGTDVPLTVKCLPNPGGVRVATFKVITTQPNATNREIIYTVTQRAVYETIADRFAPGNICYDNITLGVKIGTPDETPIYFKWGSLIGLSGYSDGDVYDSGDVLYSPTGYSGVMTTWAQVPFITENANTATPPEALLVNKHVVTAGKGDICRLVPGGRWRMPTAAEWQALINLNSTSLKLTDYYSTKGFWLGKNANTATADLPAGCVFISATGQRGSADGKTVGIGVTGYYYTGTPNTTNVTIWTFANGAVPATSNAVRTGAFPIRCIME